MESPWTKSPTAVLEHFGVNANRGLSSEQAAKHAELYGKNGKSQPWLEWCQILS
jgi:Cation transporter/ATPase, N-terminus.